LVALEAEPSPGRVELHGRHAKIGDGAVDVALAALVQHILDRAIVGMNELHPITPWRERLARLVESVQVAIKTDETRSARLQPQPRMSAETHGAVHEKTASFRP